jgi:hypothetical protein
MILAQILFLKNQVYSQRCGGVLLDKDACSKSGCVPVYHHWHRLILIPWNYLSDETFSTQTVSLAGYFLVQSTNQDILTRLVEIDSERRGCDPAGDMKEPRIQLTFNPANRRVSATPSLCHALDCQVHPKDQAFTCMNLFFVFSIPVCPNLLQLESERDRCWARLGLPKWCTRAFSRQCGVIPAIDRHVYHWSAWGVIS